MADAVNPAGAMGQTTPMSTVDQSTQVPATRRPGMITFAAFMMFLLGGFQFTWALVEFANAAWISANVYGSFGGYLWLWGILDVIFAAAALYAGYDLLRGGAFGQIFAVLIAGFSAIRWFFYLPAAPWVAIVIIAVDILIIYGIVSNSDYFSTMGTA
jgi:hypothetical protein